MPPHHDLRFTDASGRLDLPYEVERWDTNAPACPTTGAGCVLWLRADRGIETDAWGRVTVWADQSGQQHHFRQLHPKYRPSPGAPTPSGLPSVEWDGTDDRMESALDVAPPYTLFAVLSYDELCESACVALQGGKGWWIGQERGRVRCYSGSAYLDNEASVVIPGRWWLLAVQNTGESSRWMVDGVDHTGFALLTSSPGRLALGGSARVTPTFRGRIAELVVYRRLLSDADLAAIGGYLTRRHLLNTQWNTSPGESFVWVQVPELRPGTVIYAEWGRGEVSAPSPSSVWTNGFVAVYHFQETKTTEVVDASPWRHHGRLDGRWTWQPGVVGHAVAFGQYLHGAEGWFVLPDMITRFPSGAATVEVWLRLLYPRPGDFTHSGLMWLGGGPMSSYPETDGRARLSVLRTNLVENIELPNSLSLTDWHHLAIATEPGPRGKWRMYLNGQLVAETNATPLGLSENPTVGRHHIACFNGRMDEWRLSAMARSSNWIWAACQTARAPSPDVPAFQSYGEVMETERPVLGELHAAALSDRTVQVEGMLKSGGSSPPNMFLVWSTENHGWNVDRWRQTGQIRHLEPIVGQRWTEQITNLHPNRRYYINAFATNASGTTWAQGTDAISVVTFGPPQIRIRIEPARHSLEPTLLTGELTAGGTAYLWICLVSEWGSARPQEIGWVQQGSFSIPLSELEPAERYRCDAFASNEWGVAQDSVGPFTAPYGRLFYVVPGGTGAQTGTSWEDAFADIQDGLDMASRPGDIVCLRHGTWALSRTLVISNAAGLTLRGGYAGVGSPGPPTNALSVVTSAQGIHDRLLLIAQATVTVERLALTGAVTSFASELPEEPTDTGAGCLAVSSSVTWHKCSVADHRVTVSGRGAEFRGAGLCLRDCDAVLRDCRIERNAFLSALGGERLVGAGLFAAGGRLTIQGGSVVSNLVGGASPAGAWSGIGAALIRTVAAFSNVAFEANGSGLPSAEGTPFSLQGTALFVGEESSADLTRCKFFGHTLGDWAAESGGASTIFVDASAWARFSHCVVQENGLLRDPPSGQDTWGMVLLGRPRGPASPGEVRLECTLIQRNRGTALGIHAPDTPVWIQNCLLASNRGHGTYATGGRINVRNVTAVDHTGWGIFATGAVLTVGNSILWRNAQGGIAGATAVKFTCAQELHPGSGNFQADPLFTAGERYDLQSQTGTWHGDRWIADANHSPCIDAGDPDDPDWIHEPEPNGRRVNLGAWGGTPWASKSLPAGMKGPR